MKKYDLRFKWAGIAWIMFAILVGCVAPAAEETATVQPVTTTPTIIAVTSSPTVTLSPTLSPTAATETPTPDSSIPLCTFATGAASEVAGPSLDDYAFSEPQVVLTHTSAIGIAEWLPDGEQLLITRDIPGTNRQTIETFNVHTGRIRQYVERHSMYSTPIWLAAQQAVAFVDSTSEEGWVLRLSHDKDQSLETLQDHLASFYLAAGPTGREVSVLLRDQGARPAVIDLPGEATRSLDARLLVKPWLISPEAPLTWEQIYRVTWSPRGKWLANYSATGFYLLDPVTGRTCELDLGFNEGEYQYGKRWALDAQWSPDERYLAMLTTVGELPVDFIDLTVLDTTTGELRSMHPKVYTTPGQYYVQDIAWSPKSQILTILATVEYRAGTTWEGLYLVEVATGRNRRMLSQAVFPAGDAGWNLAWSPDGNSLAVTCLHGPLCLIEVTQP